MHEQSAAFDSPLIELDLNSLRLAFVPLFDRAAHVVQLAGLEQDDSIIDRYLVCRDERGTERIIPAQWLSHRERLIESVCAAFDNGPASGIRLTGIKVQVNK